MNLILFKGHNYYNRKIKFHYEVQDYLDDGLEELHVIEDCAFIMNDGITTTQIVNYPLEQEALALGLEAPSYAILQNPDVISDELEILSRWWVTESVITRKGQAKLTLVRDVIADNYEVIIRCPSLIRRGYLKTTDNPLIFSPENYACNQIKQSEQALYDKTKMPWIVGYVARNCPTTEITIPTSSLKIDYETSLGSYTYNTYVTNPFKVYSGKTQFLINFYGKYDFFSSPILRKRCNAFAWKQNGSAANVWKNDFYSVAPYILGREDRQAELGYHSEMDFYEIIKFGWNYEDDIKEAIQEGPDWSTFNIPGYDTSIKSDSELATLQREDGKIIKDSNKYYKIHVRPNPDVIVSTVEVSGTTPLGEAMRNVKSRLPGFFELTSEYNEPRFEIQSKVETYNIWYEEITPRSAKLVINQDRPHLTDAPYDMFCIPVGKINTQLVPAGFEGPPTDFQTTTNAESAWQLAGSIIDALQSGQDAYLYDIQLLPYCPLTIHQLDFTQSVVKIHTAAFDDPYYYVNVLGDPDYGIVYSAVIWCDRSSFSIWLNDYKINVPEDPYDFKIANQCDSYRLCSPNYNGQFEFSATKNGGVSGWTVNCTYKPYTPFIQVAPKFGRLYGGNFNDARGLICSGDFSITQISDAWKTYQIQNKNYENIFKAQITNMDSVREIQRKQEVAGMIGGTISGAGTGAMAGGMAFGAPGAIAGGIVGAGMSAVGGALDLKYSEELYRLNKNYTKELYQFGIENIQALPYSITKVGSQTLINKLVPFVEKYSATEEEKQILLDKLIYNSFTVEAIGFIPDYWDSTSEIGTFIQATPIRLETTSNGEGNLPTEFIEESHMAEFIAKELQEGVYFL